MARRSRRGRRPVCGFQPQQGPDTHRRGPRRGLRGRSGPAAGPRLQSAVPEEVLRAAQGLVGVSLEAVVAIEDRLLPEALSKEPMAAASRQADPVWADAVRWIAYALIEAEEQGVTRANLAALTDRVRSDPRQARLRRFLGLEGELGRSLGLPADFAAKAVAAVGNYGELFERNLGQGSPLGLERGANALWRRGGVLIAPPFR